MQDHSENSKTSQAEPDIRFDQAVLVWLKISLLSFGGPAGQIAVMHRLLVDELKWVSERRFLHALNFYMLLPGPARSSRYLGWLFACVGVWWPAFCSSCPAR